MPIADRCVALITQPTWAEWLSWRTIWSAKYLRTLLRRKYFIERYGIGFFGIFWAGQLASREPAFKDAAGRPFADYQRAVLREIELLQKMP